MAYLIWNYLYESYEKPTFDKNLKVIHIKCLFKVKGWSKIKSVRKLIQCRKVRGNEGNEGNEAGSDSDS